MASGEALAAVDAVELTYANASGRFNAYRFISRLGFHVPLVTLALISQPVLVVGVLVAGYGLASSFSAPLATLLTRRLGLARAMALGEVGKALGALGLGCLVALHGLTPLVFTLIAAGCQIVGGIGYTVAAIPDGMLAGAVRGLPDAPANAAQSDAKAASAMFAAFMLAGLSGAAIAQLAFPLPFFLGGMASLAAALTATRLAGLERPKAPAATKPAGKPAAEPMSAVARDAILVYGLFRGTSLSIQVGIMPMLLFVERQIPLWLFGVAFASYTFSGFLSAKYYAKLSAGLSGRAQAAAIGALSVLTFAGLALVPGLWVAIAPIPLFIASGVVRPYCLPRLAVGVTDPAVRQARIALAERAFALISAGTTLAAFTVIAFGLSLPVFLGVVGAILAVSTAMLALRV